MLTGHQLLTETHLIGPRCREWVLSWDRISQLSAARFVIVGNSHLRPPYRMVRIRPTCSHIVACYGGEGRTVIDGKIVPWGEGQVLLAPPRVYHAFEVAGSSPWKIAWVFYDDAEGPPVVAGDSPRLVKADVSSFVSTLQTLTREAGETAQFAALTNLVSLVDIYARRLCGAKTGDDRLWKLWESVEADLTHPWDCEGLARRASMSSEHLRRLCHRHYQHSPMQHVTSIRMHRADFLLRATNYKLEQIAELIGFASLYSFSAAFKRGHGMSPSNFRRNSKQFALFSRE